MANIANNFKNNKKTLVPMGREYRGTTQIQALTNACKDSSVALTELIRPFFYLTKIRYLKGNSGAEIRDKSEPRMCFQPVTHPLCGEEIPY
ncbi:hypothetical protein [Herbinix hemicellulosilytica]|uniref:hypothetical protein n=1 Tax=Herbinix hemicellulosilytica TaxID=1564487 RepID=UPI0011AF5B74|nr:hypothetical protein [Herbinix hemicellulosilytica]